MTGPTQAQRLSWARSLVARGLGATALAALAACSTFGTRTGSYTCPAVATVPDLQTLVTIAPGPNGATIQSSGRINAVSTSCTREGDTGVVSSVTIDFAGLRTTRAVGRLDLPYFVALADAAGNILGKQQYTIALNFDPDAPVTKATDGVTVHLPLTNPQLGNVYTLVVGFQLNQSQLDYNRAHLQ